eukprot:CAMPEP_0177700326 /NCGR_PEP_ID=MMETSP0484_2-20121128/6037_1 /TAXON_ID=354590 /ORGANISM="Rhodomonas lens, Strain RHODO" /LENGTH=131 /DNA_ID=CAMNT_0019211523 /DNA_START=330 /DNA_END=723 /DNA_ORIENTATION=+
MTVPATVLRAAFPGVWVWELHKVNLIDSAANEGTGVWQIGSEVGLVSHSKDFSVEFHGLVNVLHQYSCMLHLAKFTAACSAAVHLAAVQSRGHRAGLTRAVERWTDASAPSCGMKATACDNKQDSSSARYS